MKPSKQFHLSARMDGSSARVDGLSSHVDAVLDTILTMQKQISVNQATLAEFIRGHEREYDIQAAGGEIAKEQVFLPHVA